MALLKSTLRKRLATGSQGARAAAAVDVLAEVFPHPDSALVPIEATAREGEICVLLALGGQRDAVLTPDVLTGPSLTEAGVHEAVAGELYRAILHEDSAERTSPRKVLPSAEEIRSIHTGMATTTRRDKVAFSLRNGSHTALIGGSASGKTVTAAQVATLLHSDSWTVSWIDLSDPDRDAIDLIVALLTQPVFRTHKAHLVVVDDCQANPAALRAIGGILDYVAPRTRAPLRFLLAGWESTKQLLAGPFGGACRIACHGEHVLREVVSHLAPTSSQSDLQTVARISAGDLFVARLLLDLPKEELVAQDRTALANRAYEQVVAPCRLSSRAERLLYKLAALAQFEIDASATYAAEVDAQAFSRLVAARLVRKSGNYVSIGHRSLGRLLALHLEPRFSPDLGNPGAIAVSYIRESTAPQQLLTILERLDLASLARSDEATLGATFLARAWGSLGRLVHHIVAQVEADPTWGDNTGSSVFAAQALGELREDAWQPVGSFLRSRWRIAAGPTLEPAPEPPRERIDFHEIREAMAEEERTVDYPASQRAKNLDCDLMHRTWALGLLLGFEGRAPARNASRVSQLVAIAERTQLSNGAFYPDRVPWITARVLLGLAAAGESVGTSHVVRRACDWLRSPAPRGPYAFGRWPSGTGRWNTPLMTTAMCIGALVATGVTLTDRCVQSGLLISP